MQNDEERAKEEINKKTLLYYEGLKEHDFSKIKKAFWLDAKIIGVTGKGDFMIHTTKEWEERFKNPPKKHPNMIHQDKIIEHIDIAENAAIVKFKWITEFEEFTAEVIDYLSFLNIDSDWKIINKSWSSRQTKK